MALAPAAPQALALSALEIGERSSLRSAVPLSPTASAFLSVSLSLVLGCSSLTEPGNGAPPAAPDQQPAAAEPSAAPAAPPAEEEVAASHVLIAYKGALRAKPEITRTKEEAKKLAGDVIAKARGGADFADLARQLSDDPTAKTNGGSLGKFTRNRMVKPFADAAFSLKPGQLTSEPVETDFGFHVIKRTE